MAIIIENSSTCPLCDRVLNSSETYILVPPLISNINDKLFVFSDSGIHKECLKKSPLKEKLFFHIQKNEERMELSKCTVDGKLINDPKNIISLGMLTSDENEPLHEFNYLVLNKENVNLWLRKEEFIFLAKDFLKKDKWRSLSDFNYLEYLLDKFI